MKRLHIFSIIRNSSSNGSKTVANYRKVNYNHVGKYNKPTKFSNLFQQLSKEVIWNVGTQRKLDKLQLQLGNDYQSWRDILKELGKDQNIKPTILLYLLRHMRRLGIQINAEDSNNLLESCIGAKDSNLAYEFLTHNINNKNTSNNNNNVSLMSNASTTHFKHDDIYIIDDQSFKLALIACGVKGDTANINNIFDYLRSTGRKITLSMWNTLLNGYAIKNDANNALITIERMILDGIKPDVSRSVKYITNYY